MDNSQDGFPHDPSEEPERNPLEDILKAFLGPEAAAEAARQFNLQGFDFSSLAGAFGPGAAGVPLGQLQYLFQSSSGPVNWKMVQELATQRAYQSGDPRISAAEGRRVNQAFAIADLWLDPVTDFSAPEVQREAWSRVDWVAGTLAAWKEICEPVARNASRALTEALEEELGDADGSGLPPEVRQLVGSISQALPRMSSMAFGSQIGQALGAMSATSFGSSDSGLPLGKPGLTALTLRNVEEFADGLEIPSDEVLQFLAVRECAHSRLFSAVPWLAPDLFQAVARYSDEIAIDTDAIAESARSFDFQDPESLNRAMAEGVFSPEPTEAQQRSLARLETLLALIEGWVETVTARAAAPYLPHADQLREMLRRRRVTGSSGEQLLAQLVGLNLRPRQARDAAKLMSAVESERGAAGRDALWSHPDFVPSAQELADPENFLSSRESQEQTSDEYDLALEQLLAGTLGWAEGLAPEDRETGSDGGDDAPDTGGPTSE